MNEIANRDYSTDIPGKQDKLRADPRLITTLLEDMLCLEGSTKQTARLARRDTMIDGSAVKAGAKALLAITAANRSPKRWSDPEEFVLDHPKIKEHVAFSRSARTCTGAPLARAQVRVILEKCFERTSHIDIDATKHGPPGSRNLDYEPSFIIRGLSELHVNLTPAAGFKLLEAADATAPHAQCG